MNLTKKGSFCLGLIVWLVLVLSWGNFAVMAEKDQFVKIEDRDFFELCKDGNTAEITAALNMGANIYKTDSQGRTPLMVAAANNDSESVVVNLIIAGSRIDQRDNQGWTALMYAVADNSNPEISRTLVSMGADINVENNDGKTALILAIKENRSDIVKGLLQQGADVRIENNLGQNPLHFALEKNVDQEIIEELIAEDILLDREDDQGRTPLIYAVANNMVEVVEMMLERGADPLVYNEEKNNLLGIAASNNVDYELYKLLMAEDINLNHQNWRGQTPLHLLIENGAIRREVQLFLESGARVNIADDEGYNEAVYAAQYASPEILQILIETGVDVEKETVQQKTPLLIAARERTNYYLFKLLIEAGADTNARDYRGATPLMYALEHNREEIVELLLQNNADPQLRDHHNRSPVYYLERNDELEGSNVYWYIRYHKPDTGSVDLKDSKSRLKTAGLATAVPSAGHFYSGDWWPRGALFLLGEAGLYAVARNQSSSSNRNLAYGVLGVVKAWEVYDALHQTGEYNQFVEDYNQQAERYNQFIEKNGQNSEIQQLEKELSLD